MYNFITDSQIVNKAYDELENFKIVITEDGDNSLCAIYFTSHDLYYPNTEESFKYSVYDKDRYEWTNCLVNGAGKHIFLRDVHKQWYIKGINSMISSPESLLDFLKRQTMGMKVITVGSSAGGYAAIRFGEWLGADRVMAFSPRIDFNVIIRDEYETNPIARTFDLKEINLLDSIDFSKADHFIFYPTNSRLDKIQLDEIKRRGIPLNGGKWNNLHLCLLTTSHHGIPFPKVALNSVLNLTAEQLRSYAGKTISPFIFSASIVGWPKTIIGFIKQIFQGLKKIIKRKLTK